MQKRACSWLLALVAALAVSPGAATGLGNEIESFGATPASPAATVAVVPEPGTAAPIALGLLALLSSPRRRSRR